MADLNDIIADITAGIQASQKINTWAEVNYVRSCLVFENMDPRQPPGEEDCPLVIICHGGKRTGLGVAKRPHHIGVACWVCDSGQPVSIEGVRRFEGGRKVEQLRQLVVDEIVKHLPAGLQLSEVDTQHSTLADFPLIEANMALEITETWTTGSSVYD